MKYIFKIEMSDIADEYLTQRRLELIGITSIHCVLSNKQDKLGLIIFICQSGLIFQ